MKKDKPALRQGPDGTRRLPDPQWGFSIEVDHVDLEFTPTEGPSGVLRVILFNQAEVIAPYLHVIRHEADKEVMAGKPAAAAQFIGGQIWGRLYPFQNIHPQRRVNWRYFLQHVREQYGARFDPETGKQHGSGDALEHLYKLGRQETRRTMPLLRELKKAVQFDPSSLPNRSQRMRARAVMSRVAQQLVAMEQKVFSEHPQFLKKNLTNKEQVHFDRYLRSRVKAVIRKEGIDHNLKAHMTLLSYAELTEFFGGVMRIVRRSLPPQFLTRLDRKVFNLMHIPRARVMYEDGSFDLPLYRCHVFRSALEFISGVGTRTKDPLILLPDLLVALRDGIGTYPSADRAVYTAVGFARAYQSWVTMERDDDRERKARKRAP